MGDTTGIEWTDHTFNPWWGCVRVSPACEHCYAETFASRFGVKWGVKADRKIASEKVWTDPLRWNRAAEKAKVQRRVFCASMADVFEDRSDLDQHRSRLFGIIESTPHLTWQLLTKRIESVAGMVPESWRERFPPNVWIGTTVEDQRRANERIPHLLALPAAVRFLSCEPLLGPVDVTAWTSTVGGFEGALSSALGEISIDEARAALRRFERDRRGAPPDAKIDWIIAGGESGPGARPMHPDWARSLRDQCKAAGVPLFFKQWGDWAPENTHDSTARDSVRIAHVGDDMAEMWRVGKKAAGSLLDGVEHKAFPA